MAPLLLEASSPPQAQRTPSSRGRHNLLERGQELGEGFLEGLMELSTKVFNTLAQQIESDVKNNLLKTELNIARNL